MASTRCLGPRNTFRRKVFRGEEMRKLQQNGTNIEHSLQGILLSEGLPRCAARDGLTGIKSQLHVPDCTKIVAHHDYQEETVKTSCSCFYLTNKNLILYLKDP